MHLLGRLIFNLLFVAAILWSGASYAQPGRQYTGKQIEAGLDGSDIPHIISYQGTLFTKEGQPVPDGDYALTFKIYGDEEGNEVIWEGTYSAFVQGGIFNAYLGSGNAPLPPIEDLDRKLWLGVRVGEASEFRPLTPLSASPFALNVANSAITTDKIKSGSVTKDKLNVDYIEGVSINGQKISGRGSRLNFVGRDGIDITYDPVTESIYLSNKNPTPTSDNSPSKGADALANTTVNGNLVVNGSSDFGGSVSNTTITFKSKAASNLNMNTYKVTGLADPTDSTDAASRGWVLKQTGNGNLSTATVTGTTNLKGNVYLGDNSSDTIFFKGKAGNNLDMNFYRITHLADPIGDSDATSKLWVLNQINNSPSAGLQLAPALQQQQSSANPLIWLKNQGASPTFRFSNPAGAVAAELSAAGDLSVKSLATSAAITATGDITSSGKLKGNTLEVSGNSVLTTLSGAGTNRFAGSVAIPAGYTEVNIGHTGVQMNSVIIATYQDLAALAMLTPMVSQIIPGTSFTVSLSGPVPVGANAKMHFLIVNP